MGNRRNKVKVGGKGVNVSVAAKSWVQTRLPQYSTGEIEPAAKIPRRQSRIYFGRTARTDARRAICIDEKIGKETTFLGADIPVERTFEKWRNCWKIKSAGDIFAFAEVSLLEKPYADRLSICKSKTPGFA
ncbi:MAG: hypothetical protein ACLUKN_01310 [Bacilli bacterium]